MSANRWAMERIRNAIKRVAPLRIAILIRGQPSVGKGFLARTIHKLSGRTGDFVILNCMGVSADRIETDLFGCETRNSFGATDTKVGSIEAARCGTIFLEEIGEMPPHLQAKLLRAVENREVVPVGGTRPRHVDARFISSSSQDLDAACSDGRFRADLFFRLNGVTLEIPPLRERTDEIPRLVDTFINDFGRDFGRDSGHQPNIAGHARHRRVFIKGFRRESDRQQSFRMIPDAMDILLRYPWPGNIGELKKVIGRALLLCDGSEISPNHLTIEMSATSEGLAGQMGVDAKPEGEDPQHAARSPESDGGRVLPLQSPEAIAERERILEALESAKSLMRSRGTLGYGPLQELESQCSLCGQLERKVRMLISGPRVFICDDCVKESQRIAYAAAESDGPVSLRLKNVLPRYPYVSCAFCGKSSTEVRRLVGGDKALICDECLDLCDHILGERFAGEWPLGIGDAKPLKQLRLTDRRSENRPFASGSDLGLMSPTEAVSRARAAKMLLCFNPRISDVPVFSLREADDEFCEDDPLVMPRKTFTLRPVYPAAAIDAQISQASDQLSHDNPCRIVILVEDGGPDSARRLLDRVKMALRDIAEFREQDAALRRAALTAIALPRPGSDPGA